MSVEIKKAIERKQLVVFLGSGISIAGGLPSWEQLAYNVIKGKAKCVELKAIESKHYGPRRLMSLARTYFNDDDEFRKSVCDQLRDKPVKPNGKRLHEILKSWDVSVITTNYDLLFDESEPKYKTYHSIHDEKLNRSTLFDDRFVLHIHGSIEDADHMILTESDYFDMYYLTHMKRVREVMEWIFNEPDIVVLFIGSRLEELEILQFTVKSEGDVAFSIYLGISVQNRSWQNKCKWCSTK